MKHALDLPNELAATLLHCNVTRERAIELHEGAVELRELYRKQCGITAAWQKEAKRLTEELAICRGDK